MPGNRGSLRWIAENRKGRPTMEMAIESLEGDVTKVVFDGRFDIAGAQAVDLKMNVLAGTKKLVLLDMQKVSFLGSMGLRTIVTVVRTVKSRGGKIVVFAPGADVEKVLTMSGVNTLVPIHHDLQSAIAYLQ
jgi:anti-sigma B factor antagonist